MPTPAHIEHNRSKPDGANNPPTHSDDTMNNDNALAAAIVFLRSAGFIMTRTQGTGPDLARPQYLIFTAGAIVFRMTITWTGYNPTTIQHEWSNDTGTTWANVGAAQVSTFDANQNITATTNSANSWVLETWAKCLKVVADLATHIAAVGTAVHGLGTAAVANLAAMAITGTSSFDGTGGVGQTTIAAVDATRVREKFNDYGAIANAATVTLQVDQYAHMAFTPSVTQADTMTIAVSGAPASGKSQTVMFEIINGRRSADAKITWPATFKWVGGSTTRPTDLVLELAGRNLFSMTTRDGGTIWDIMHLGKRG